MSIGGRWLASVVQTCSIGDGAILLVQMPLGKKKRSGVYSGLQPADCSHRFGTRGECSRCAVASPGKSLQSGGAIVAASLAWARAVAIEGSAKVVVPFCPTLSSTSQHASSSATYRSWNASQDQHMSKVSACSFVGSGPQSRSRLARERLYRHRHRSCAASIESITEAKEWHLQV